MKGANAMVNMIMLHDTFQIVFLFFAAIILAIIVGVMSIYKKYGLKKMLVSIIPALIIAGLAFFGATQIKVVSHPYSVRIQNNQLIQNYFNANTGEMYENRVSTFGKIKIINKNAKEKDHPAVERTLTGTKIIYEK